jgi:hypothetical protein
MDSSCQLAKYGTRSAWNGCLFCENGCFGCLWPGGLYALRASGLGVVLQSFDLAPVAPFVIVFCSRGLNGNGLESEFATANLFGLAMTGRGGLFDPAESEEVEPGSGEDGGRYGRLCGGGSMVARWSQLCCGVELSSVVAMLSGCRRDVVRLKECLINFMLPN